MSIGDTPTPVESANVSLVGYHDLEGRPGFKIQVHEQDGQWFLYLGHIWHRGWSILDVTDPANPVLERFIEGPAATSTSQLQLSDGLLITGLEQPLGGQSPVDGPHHDPGDPFEEGAYLWDVTADPTDPERLSHWETGGEGTHRNFYLKSRTGDYAYMAASAPPGFHGRIPIVVDVSDPRNPEEVARWWLPGQGPDDEEVPTESYYFHGPAFVVGEEAFLSYGTAGMVVLDVSEPTDPTYKCRLDFGGLGTWLGCHTANPIPGTDLVACTTEAILEGTPLERPGGDPLQYAFLVDVSDTSQDPHFVAQEDLKGGSTRDTTAEVPEGLSAQDHVGPRIVASLPLPRPEEHLPYDNYDEKPGRFGPHNQYHYREGEPVLRTEEYLIACWFNAGLRIFDISDPLAPTEAGYYVPDDPPERIGPRPQTGLVTQFEDVVVDERGYIYCTDKNRGLFVLESGLF